jgi:hypothetical protein
LNNIKKMFTLKWKADIFGKSSPQPKMHLSAILMCATSYCAPTLRRPMNIEYCQNENDLSRFEDKTHIESNRAPEHVRYNTCYGP